MEKVIRHQAFETNSSSTHSVTIAELSPDIDKAALIQQIGFEVSIRSGEKYLLIKPEPGEFGWGYDSFTDPLTKIAYLIQWELSKGPIPEEFKRYGSFVDFLQDDLLREFFASEGIKYIRIIMTNFVVNEDNFSTFYPSGYIDHQSIDDSTLAPAFESRKALLDFIFSIKSYLIIDNDNH